MHSNAANFSKTTSLVQLSHYHAQLVTKKGKNCNYDILQGTVKLSNLFETILLNNSQEFNKINGLEIMLNTHV